MPLKSGHTVFQVIADNISIVTVDGSGSYWSNSSVLGSGYNFGVELDITNDAMVSAYSMKIDDYEISGGHVKISTGGMLALFGDADGSLADFLI